MYNKSYEWHLLVIKRFKDVCHMNKKKRFKEKRFLVSKNYVRKIFLFAEIKGCIVQLIKLNVDKPLLSDNLVGRKLL